MLGRYDFFPDIYHGRMNIEYDLDKRTLQTAIIKVLLKLNNEEVESSEITGLENEDLHVYFEFGFAEGRTFTFIDEEEAAFILREIRENPFDLMDVFCALKYYRVIDGRLRPLKFDYNMIRFKFEDGSLSVLFFHERGPRRIEFSLLMKFILKRMHSLLGEKHRKELKTISLFEV